MPSEIDQTPQWRALAAEALGLAQELTDPAAKEVMLWIVERYMQMAERADRQSKDDPSE